MDLLNVLLSAYPFANAGGAIGVEAVVVQGAD